MTKGKGAGGSFFDRKHNLPFVSKDILQLIVFDRHAGFK